MRCSPSLTDDVARLVLRNNYQQTLALSLAERRGLEDLGFQQRMMQTLEGRHLLDRAVEFLPDDMELTERRRRSLPLTRPEISVLLAYAKLTLNDDLLASAVPDDPYLGRELTRYFPPAIAEKFPDALDPPPAAARDHRDAARQFDDQPRRADARGADFRPDRRIARPHRGGVRGGAQQLRPDRPQHRDRRPRQPDRRQAPARSVRFRAGPPARPHRLVPAQCRSDPGARRRDRALPGRGRDGCGRARRRAHRDRQGGAHGARGRARGRRRARRRWRAASPTCRR